MDTMDSNALPTSGPMPARGFTLTLGRTEAPIRLRPGRAEDADSAGRTCHAAFAGIACAHNFPADFPSEQAAIDVMRWLLGHRRIHSVVAEQEGRVVGTNFLDCRDPVAGVGPITVDPAVQDKALGRALMEAVLDHAQHIGAAGVRLVQAAYHGRSLSLYTKLGFAVREPLACMQGEMAGALPPGCLVRPAETIDLAACNGLAERLIWHARGGALEDAIAQKTATVVVRRGRITGYASAIGFFGHAVGESNVDLAALIAATKIIAGPGLLVPMRNVGLFRWCLEHGLRVVQPLTLMSVGDYDEPPGVFLPSILY